MAAFLYDVYHKFLFTDVGAAEEVEELEIGVVLDQGNQGHVRHTLLALGDVHQSQPLKLREEGFEVPRGELLRAWHLEVLQLGKVGQLRHSRGVYNYHY